MLAFFGQIADIKCQMSGNKANLLEGPYKLVGHELAAPLFNAAGAINDYNVKTILEYAKLLAKTGVGAIQAGSFTIPPSVGNEALYGPPTHCYNSVTGEMTNSKGLPNPGKDEALAISHDLISIAHEAGKIAIFSVSPTKDAGDSVDQAVELAEDFLGTEADLVIINVSCPNVVTEGGARKPVMGYDYETMHRLVEKLWGRVGKTARLGVKSANHVTDEEKLVVPQLAKLYRNYPVFSWMEGPNTIPGHVPVDTNGNQILSVPGGAGGLSGPATKQNGQEQLNMWHEQVGDFVDLVRTQGLDSGKELAWSLGYGAVAGSGVSFLWNSSNWQTAVERILTEFAVEIVGTDRK